MSLCDICGNFIFSDSIKGHESCFFEKHKRIAALERDLAECRAKLAEAEARANAAQKLCEIYFNVAAAVVGEDEVRKRREQALAGKELKT